MNLAICKKCMALNYELAVTCHNCKELLFNVISTATLTTNTYVRVNTTSEYAKQKKGWK